MDNHHQQTAEEPQQQVVVHGGDSNSTSRTIYSDSGICYNIPPGFRFCPTDEELVSSYLIPKVNNLPIPFTGIPLVNLYNYNPVDLTREYSSQRELNDDDEWYFFTSRNRKDRNGCRPNRKAGDGYWKPTGNEFEVNDSEEKTIGYRKALDYYIRNPEYSKRSDWKMHEYRLDQKGPDPRTLPNGQPDMQLDECVLCKIYLSKRKKKSENSQEENTGNSTMNENAGHGPTVQTNEPVVQPQYNNLVSPNPDSTAHAFAWPQAYEPSNFQMFDYQNNSFLDQGLWAVLNHNMFQTLPNLSPMPSGGNFVMEPDQCNQFSNSPHKCQRDSHLHAENSIVGSESDYGVGSIGPVSHPNFPTYGAPMGPNYGIMDPTGFDYGCSNIEFQKSDIGDADFPDIINDLPSPDSLLVPAEEKPKRCKN